MAITWRKLAYFDEIPPPSSGGGLTWTVVNGNFSAIKSTGYACNTSGGAITMTLPAAPAAGDVIAVTDAAGAFDANNLTVGRNGLKIMGLTEDMTISTKHAAFSLVYVDAANGWRIA